MNTAQTIKVIHVPDLKKNNKLQENTYQEICKTNKTIDEPINTNDDRIDNNETNETNEPNETKKIMFTGTTTKYQMKKIDPVKKEKKKRVETDTWGLEDIHLSFETQLEILRAIYSDLKTEQTNKSKRGNKYNNLIVSHVKTKISSYKHQDILKNILDENEFVDFSYVIQLLYDCDLKCHYCDCEIFLLYEFVREMKQWSLDRINNDIGHNKNNLVIACLECNLKRRRTNKDSFMFTKNLKISREGL
jgi:hypothetical protein